MTIEGDKYWTAEAENKLGSWNEAKVMTLFFFKHRKSWDILNNMFYTHPKRNPLFFPKDSPV